MLLTRVSQDLVINRKGRLMAMQRQGKRRRGRRASVITPSQQSGKQAQGCASIAIEGTFRARISIGATRMGIEGRIAGE